ncbi:MAG: bifunctional diaminohydroxyphosphoribosylaminopyrimidine deaminase/5-amino-6-(5-phosphoribosylamino)uracil reductase RibD [Acidimicrobiia bacterium]
MDADAEFMQRALALASTARRRSAPNPWVGCVLVRGADIVGEGATEAPGGAHGEVVALRNAGDRARGATAYTTLEPCAHHGRTPPCADALLAAGVARVVIALADPDPLVAGSGIAMLREHGATVDVGVGADEARRSLAPYLVHRQLGRSFTVVKTALSLDGRTAARDGSSRWITGPQARADVHRLRADSQAVVVGSGTALADHPSLTARDVEPPVEREALRVVLDARGRVPAVGPLFETGQVPTLVITTEAASPEAQRAWMTSGAEVLIVPPAPNGCGVDLHASLEVLAELGVLQALVEGGAQLAGALVEAGLADRLVTYIAPVLLGREGRPAFDVAGPATLADAARLQLVDAVRLGHDVRLDYEPEPLSQVS